MSPLFANPVHYVWTLTDMHMQASQLDTALNALHRVREATRVQLTMTLHGEEVRFDADWLRHITRVPVTAARYEYLQSELAEANDKIRQLESYIASMRPNITFAPRTAKHGDGCRCQACVAVNQIAKID